MIGILLVLILNCTANEKYRMALVDLSTCMMLSL